MLKAGNISYPVDLFKCLETIKIRTGNIDTVFTYIFLKTHVFECPHPITQGVI